ncbi:MAG: lytic transglycosylase domain-containing protein [Pigmentiphaga sp.]|uniref:lytic transglycosylase domain-containing protein n=1 Tax=Pigmentiphaga sp. TaxID=1977564 RepID=UPI00299FD631|nr:lytic transglycosylase domain-containing protein [Pigmentiphaga sp.]MDX3904751.1 lytic transglycosylase domain-containing protein [Pigmentiphaga sp.]
MPDAQSRSSLKQAAAHVREGMAKWSRSMIGYGSLAVLVAAVVAVSVPQSRTQILQLRDALVGVEAAQAEPLAQTEAAAPAELDSEPAGSVPAASPVPAKSAVLKTQVHSHSHTVAFLGSMGDGQVARKLPVVKVSAVQTESLGRYIARKYRVSNEATRMLISTAYGVGQEMGLDPLLLLAIIAIESSFNPFAESHVGAQGLMQVLTRVHSERFEPFGGDQAAWNPVANIRVGASILKEYIERGGSLAAGLRMYVGVGPDGSSPYGDKVLAERRRLASAAGLPPDLPGYAPAAPAAAERSAKAQPIPTQPSEAVSVKSPDPDAPAVM